MSIAPTTDTAFVCAQRDQLAVLLDALEGVVISDAERHSLTWLTGWERHTIENVAAVIRRARAAENHQAAKSATRRTT